MNQKRYNSVKISALLILTIALFFGTVAVKANSASDTVWLWRQPPYEIYYGYVVPWVEVVAWGGNDHKVIYAGNTDVPNETNIPNGIYRSADYGLTWDYLGNVDEKEAITELVVHPTKPNIVLAGFNRTYYQAGIYRSEDSGDSWTSVLPYLIVNDIEIDPSNPSIMYATGLESGGMPTPIHAGVYKSIDEGKTWQYISSSYFFDITVNPVSSNILFGTLWIYGGIYRSEDSGETWMQISDIQEKQIIINKNNPNQMFIFGADYKGIWRTDDAGVNWRNVTSNLPYLIANQTIQSAIIDPSSPNTIWVGLKYGGMYVSYDSGEYWQLASDGLSSFGIYGRQCLAGDMANNQMVIACDGLLYIQSQKSIPDTVKSVSSIGAEDGWILESAQTRDKGGSQNSISSTLRLGNDASGKEYRSILSFNTKLPVNAVITKITFKIKKQSVTGGRDPFVLLGGMAVKIKKGTFNMPSLELKDFQSLFTNEYGLFNPTASAGWYTLDLSGAAPYFNWSGKTQIRLQFLRPDDQNRKANFISFYSGNSGVTNRPVLSIGYYVP
jgi:photosystem II stability/assembly factor-like uncharacterized protein